MPGIKRKEETGCQWCDSNVGPNAIYGHARRKAHPLMRSARWGRMPFCSKDCKSNWQKAMEDAGYETK